jgi:hypothetical protein
MSLIVLVIAVLTSAIGEANGGPPNCMFAPYYASRRAQSLSSTALWCGVERALCCAQVQASNRVNETDSATSPSSRDVGNLGCVAACANASQGGPRAVVALPRWRRTGDGSKGT